MEVDVVFQQQLALPAQRRVASGGDPEGRRSRRDDDLEQGSTAAGELLDGNRR
jgi:hypothetical protein